MSRLDRIIELLGIIDSRTQDIDPIVKEALETAKELRGQLKSGAEIADTVRFYTDRESCDQELLIEALERLIDKVKRELSEYKQLVDRYKRDLDEGR